LSKLNKIVIRTKRQIFSEMISNNPSIFEGEGFDFSELREYEYGDDVKKIDWNITAKRQKPYIRVFNEERELNIVVVALMDGSLNFGSKEFKVDILAEIVALLGFSAIKNSDRFSFISYCKSGEFIVRGSKNINSINSSLSFIFDSKLIGNRCNYEDLSKELFSMIKKRSIIFVLGDFFQKIDLRLLSKKHEVISIMIRDRLEEELPDLGVVNLCDPSTLNSLRTDLSKDLKREYKKRVLKIDHENFEHFRKNRISFIKIYTHEKPFSKLKKLFIKR